MQTRKLYYENCLLQSFEAQVLSCEKTEKGYLVTLDATAFYPEGGGQACDLGRLGDVNVLDVRERGEEVVHLCDGALHVGERVCGTLDWARRLDQMQQHSGEHILSGLIHQKFGYHNVGFHVGNQGMEVDFDGPITWEELLELEAKANAAVWQNLPVQWQYPAPEVLAQLTYRSKKALDWPVRIVTIEGYDRCACCGVHVERTGQIGLIKVLSCVKFHQGVRIEMLCGKRAFDYLTQIQEQNRNISRLLSAKPLNTAAAAEQMQQQLTREKYRVAALEKQVFAQIAREYENAGDVVYFADDLTPGSLRELTDTIAGSCGGRAAVFSGTDEQGYSVCIFGKAEDVRTLGQSLCKTLDGRGGGKPGQFQGSVKASRTAIEAFFAKE